MLALEASEDDQGNQFEWKFDSSNPVIRLH